MSEELQKLQHLFDTDLENLATLDEDDVEYLEQNHFGDLLVEKSEFDKERYKLWRNLDQNVDQGESLIEIEYSGVRNKWTWETILEFNN